MPSPALKTRVGAVLLTVAAAAAQAAGDPPSRFATVDGARIHYKVHGRGRTAIVLVHGSASDMTAWRDQIPRLALKATVIAVDLPGDRTNLRQAARAVRAVMDDARVPRAILAARGTGTAVIRQVDRLFPTRVRALVVIDGARELSADDILSVPMLVLATTADDEAHARSLATDVDYQVIARPEDLTARLEAWLVRKGYLR